MLETYNSRIMSLQIYYVVYTMREGMTSIVDFIRMENMTDIVREEYFFLFLLFSSLRLKLLRQLQHPFHPPQFPPNTIHPTS